MTRLWKMITLPGIAALILTFSSSALLVTFNAYSKHLEVSTTGTEFPARISQKVTMPIPVGLVRRQDHSPLLYTGIEVDKAHRLTSLNARNISGRQISAFCLATRNTFKVTSSLTYQSTNLMDPVVMMPSETKSWEEDLSRVSDIWVDFVEFTDGATWGPNETGFKEKLAAERGGAYIAASRYLRILHKHGPEAGVLAVVAAMRKPVIDSKSAIRGEFLESEFKSGVERVCVDLVRALGFVPDEVKWRPEDYLVAREKFDRILRSYTEFHR